MRDDQKVTKLLIPNKKIITRCKCNFNELLFWNKSFIQNIILN